MVSYSEFIVGCLRMEGAAKTVDVATLMYENKRMMMKWVTFMESVENNFNLILGILAEKEGGGLYHRSNWRNQINQ